MYQLLKGVAHMHKHGVMHRDLKPQNLLVDDSVPHPLLKVADLGLGRHFTIPIKAYTHEVRGAGSAAAVAAQSGSARAAERAAAQQPSSRAPLPCACADCDAVVPRARGAAGRHALRARRGHLVHRLHHG